MALAIERSRIDQERLRQLATERAVALTLQHSLMPAVPAEIGPIRLRAAYRAGDPGVEVGGDWFDAVAVDDGVVLLVGDVQGHDLAAAALMGQLRTVGRAAAGEGRSPSGVLESMNRYLERSDSELLATALVAHLNVTTDEIVVASAGHLSPIVLAPDQQAWAASELEDVPGPPLGVGNEWSDRRRVVPAGSILLLYTDGLVESRTWPLQDGIDLLLHTLAGLSVDIELNDVLEAALDLLPTGSRGDDVAVLAASVPSRQISRARRAGRAGR